MPREKDVEFRENTWLPSFHLFGFPIGLALTFQPSPFQYTLTVRRTPELSYTRPSMSPPLKPSRTEFYSGHQSPLVSRTNSCSFLKEIVPTLMQGVPSIILKKNSLRP